MEGVFANTEPTLVDCRPGFSFFFELIRKECNGRSPAPLHRICTLMRKMGVQSFVREELDPNAEILDEKQSASVRTGGGVDIKAIRLTFFRDLPASGKWHDLDGGKILGYAVMVSLQLPDGTGRCYILEAVVRSPSVWFDQKDGGFSLEPVTNYYLHCSREFQTVIGTAKTNVSIPIKGSFFCQQNDLTHVCAHAALRMGINSTPFAKSKVTNSSINNILGIDHTSGHVVGKYGANSDSIGLTAEQIAGVVKAMGWEPHLADFGTNPAIDYEDFIYPFIESGCPTILGIHNPRTAHVLTVLGHSLNSDRWTPEARHGYGAFPISPHISTSAWVDHFIVSDDNYGMYVTLPTDSIRNILVPKYNPNLHATLAIGLLPKGVNITGYQVEQSAAVWVSKLVQLANPAPANRWFQLLKEPNQQLVCRTLLTNKTDYVNFMKSVEDDQKRKLSATEVATLATVLPDRFWVTEITVPNLYAGNKRKLGDVITLATATQQQFLNATVCCWLPGLFLSSAAKVSQGWSLFGHIPLLRGASQGEQRLEW